MLVLNPDQILYEDEDLAVAIPDDPISKGHVIIKTKESYQNLQELPELLLARILSITQACVRSLKKQYDFPGYSIMQNGGIYNEDKSFCFHMIPRYNNTDFKWTYIDEVDEEAKDFQRIKAYLKDDFKTMMLV